MVAFEIQLNGSSLYSVGLEDDKERVCGNYITVELMTPNLRSAYIEAVGCITNIESGIRESSRWPRHSLQIGDIVTVTVLETNSIDGGIGRESITKTAIHNPQQVREAYYQRYLELKAEFEADSHAD